MRRDNSVESDLERSWRQTVRWLVGDVPGRVEVSVRPKADSASPAVEISVRVRDAEYRPLDNAKVALQITPPGGKASPLDAEPDGREAGSYAATYVTKTAGCLSDPRHGDRPRRQHRRRTRSRLGGAAGGR